MTPADAARLLDLPPDATIEQLETRFLDLRRKLEDKIAKAPTPGLQAKYRASLTEITTAFEQLTLAADADTLPVLERFAPESTSAPSAPSPSAPPLPTPRPPLPASKSNREFLIVAVVAVFVLLTGGWWIVKTRAENTERVRIAAAAQAQLEREKAEEARRLAEAKAQREAQAAQLRGRLAVHKTNWAIIEKELSAAERRANNLRSEARSGGTNTHPGESAALLAEAAAHGEVARWLETIVLGGTATANIAKLEAQVAGMLLDEAKATEAELAAELEGLGKETKARKDDFLRLEGPFTLNTTPSGLAVTIQDAYGRVRKGISPFSAQLPWGATVLTVAGPTEEWHP